MNSQR